ncbi:6-carboxytetrahydropterin synthase [Lacticaseibacillus sp. N501-2]|uniref:6-carboxytetrahydropterin synthase n=1 Tax=Lacticaseibacillus salsurae TaxID=3367729 RepID=UPI0038B2C85F
MSRVYSYKLKSYLNASHAMRWEGGIGQAHNHTWEIVSELRTTQDMVAFNNLEKALHGVLDNLSGKFLNDLPEFETINPSVENVASYLFDEIDTVLRTEGARLVRIEVSDSPTRAYCIDIRDTPSPD